MANVVEGSRGELLNSLLRNDENDSAPDQSLEEYVDRPSAKLCEPEYIDAANVKAYQYGMIGFVDACIDCYCKHTGLPRKADPVM